MALHRKTIGDIEVTAISDGYLNLTTDRILNWQPADVEKQLGLASGAPMRIDVNSFLLKRGGKYMMIDAGSGPNFGPTLGLQPDSLRKLGVEPSQIEMIFLTHMHPDHSNGLVDGSGKAVYTNAEIVVHEKEASFWLDVDVPANADDMVRNSQRNNRISAAAYPGRFRRIKDGEAAPGISAYVHPGHTPGHTAWVIQSGGEGIMIWGDIVHIAGIQIAHPEASMTFDIDPDGARASRRHAFDRAAADRLYVAGAHIDFPGFGAITRKGTGYGLERT